MSEERFAVVARPNSGTAEMVVAVFETRDAARDCMSDKSDAYPQWDFRIEEIEVVS